MCYLGLWLIMSMQVKTNERKKIDPHTSEALFKLNEVMAYNRFCEITRAFTYKKNKTHPLIGVNHTITYFIQCVYEVYLLGWVGQLFQWKHEYMDKKMDLPRVGVCST